jgi:hypothetical protein
MGRVLRCTSDPKGQARSLPSEHGWPPCARLGLGLASQCKGILDQCCVLPPLQTPKSIAWGHMDQGVTLWSCRGGRTALPTRDPERLPRSFTPSRRRSSPTTQAGQSLRSCPTGMGGRREGWGVSVHFISGGPMVLPEWASAIQTGDPGVALAPPTTQAGQSLRSCPAGAEGGCEGRGVCPPHRTFHRWDGAPGPAGVDIKPFNPRPGVALAWPPLTAQAGQSLRSCPAGAEGGCEGRGMSTTTPFIVRMVLIPGVTPPTGMPTPRRQCPPPTSLAGQSLRYGPVRQGSRGRCE